MCVSACMCACVYICVYAYVCTHVCICEWMYMCRHYVCACMCICVHVYVYVCLCIYVCICVRVCCVHAHVGVICVYVCVHVCVCMYECRHACACVCIHIHLYTRTQLPRKKPRPITMTYQRATGGCTPSPQQEPRTCVRWQGSAWGVLPGADMFACPGEPRPAWKIGVIGCRHPLSYISELLAFLSRFGEKTCNFSRLPN